MGETSQRGACTLDELKMVEGCAGEIHKLLSGRYKSYVFDLSFYAVFLVQIAAVFLSLKLRGDVKRIKTESSMALRNQEYLDGSSF